MDEVVFVNYFFIVNGRKLKQLTIIVLTALVTAWFLYIQNISFTAFSTDDGPKAFYKGKNGIALTFDISWGDSKVESILDHLNEIEVKSVTFFLSGSWVENHPHLAEKIMKEGYEIGLLGYEYLDYEEIEDAKIQQDILKAQEIFNKLGINHKKIIRAPNGHFDDRFIKIADRLGYTVVHWSVDTKDWKNPGVDHIVNAVSKAKKGDIILLHASDSATQTAVALPEIIETIKKKNIPFTTINEMLIEGKAQTKEVE